MTLKHTFMLFIMVSLLLAAPVSFGEPASTCDGLDAEKQGLYKRLLDTLHPYDCCDETITACLAKQAPCPLATRLAKDVCRLVKSGKSQTDIDHAMLKRAQSMTPISKVASFNPDPEMMAGDFAAPVTVVVYACTRCPYCRVVVPALYRDITEGSLKGKVKLYFRPFPLKDHVGSVEGGMAISASAKLGRFWPYLLKIYERYDAFDSALLPQWASELGMDREAFTRLMADAVLKETLTQTKQEGVRNKVQVTPTLFINGRKYGYETSNDVLMDVLLEEYERLKK